MEISSIITIIIVSGIALERIMSRMKKSKCLGSEVEFNDNNNVRPDFPQGYQKMPSPTSQK